MSPSPRRSRSGGKSPSQSSPRSSRSISGNPPKGRGPKASGGKGAPKSRYGKGHSEESPDKRAERGRPARAGRGRQADSEERSTGRGNSRGPSRGPSRDEGRRSDTRGERRSGGRRSERADGRSIERRTDWDFDNKPNRSGDRAMPRSSARSAENGAVIMGRNSVATLLEVSPARVRAVILEEGSGRERRLAAIVAACKEHRIRVQTVPRPVFAERLARWFEDSDEVESAELLSHQGVFAEVSPKAQPTIYQLCDRLKSAIAAGEKPLILALDKVTDARNFGAILRVADGVGAMAVLTTSRHSAQWSPAVAKTASGAEATVDVVTVPNLANGLGQLKQAGGWVIGTSDKATQSYEVFDFSLPTVLVMGSEDRGLGQVVEKACDGLVSIPMRGAVSSLNVAVATAVVAYSVQQRLLG